MSEAFVTPSSLLPPASVPGISGVTLYANGKRVPCDSADVSYDDNGVGVTVTFRTTRNCLAVGSGEPSIERAWGDKKAGQLRYVQQPTTGSPLPHSGCVAINDVIVPAGEGEPVRFRCTATTPVYDWLSDGRSLADTGEELVLEESWIGELA